MKPYIDNQTVQTPFFLVLIRYCSLYCVDVEIGELSKRVINSSPPFCSGKVSSSHPIEKATCCCYTIIDLRTRACVTPVYATIAYSCDQGLDFSGDKGTPSLRAKQRIIASWDR